MTSWGAGSIAAAPKPDPNAPRHAPATVVMLDVYQLTVPFGAICRNDDFWKRVDEQQGVDIATYDLLYKNGVRVGIGRDAEWGYFKGLLGKYPTARQQMGRTTPGKEGYIELPMRSGVLLQHLFWFDDHDGLIGRTFEKCDDLWAISFEASAHRPGETIVKLCPLVRGLRRFFFQTILNNEQTVIQEGQPEQLYDLRLQTTIPLGDFLIVAPSQMAKWPTTIGNAFLVTDGKAEPLEHVFVIVPRVFRTDEPPATR